MPDGDDFAWFSTASVGRDVSLPPPYSIMTIPEGETAIQRKMRMLRQLSVTCTACSMCELGLKPAVQGNIMRDPHVLSNMNPSKIIVIGQNPGWTELEKGTPFIGESGKNFDKELHANGVNRGDLYITNVVKCYTEKNQTPTAKHIEKCEPFLQMEINLLKPKFLVTLGAPAFRAVCPNLQYQESLGKMVDSARFNMKVFPVYHPSPLNLADSTRKEDFKSQMKTLCAVIRRLREPLPSCEE